MYIRSGLGAYRRRRGMAGGSMVNGVYVTDTPTTVDTVTASGQNIFQDSTGAVIATSSPSLISGVPNWALGVVAGVLALLVVKR